MNENKHIKVSKCVIAMVTAINHVSLNVTFSAKFLPLRSEGDWSGSRVHVIQFHQEEGSFP